jgi:hypothetical protein
MISLGDLGDLVVAVVVVDVVIVVIMDTTPGLLLWRMWGVRGVCGEERE